MENLRQIIKLEIHRILSEENLDEFSGVGAIAGYALPLGANPTDYGAPGTTSQRKRAFMTASKPYDFSGRKKRKRKRRLRML